MQSTKWFVAVLMAVAGCFVTRSTAGPFVTDIRVEGSHLAVDHCSLDYTHVVAPAALLLNAQPTGSTVSRSGCQTRTAEFPHVLPPVGAR